MVAEIDDVDDDDEDGNSDDSDDKKAADAIDPRTNAAASPPPKTSPTPISASANSKGNDDDGDEEDDPFPLRMHSANVPAAWATTASHAQSAPSSTAAPRCATITSTARTWRTSRRCCRGASSRARTPSAASGSGPWARWTSSAATSRWCMPSGSGRRGAGRKRMCGGGGMESRSKSFGWRKSSSSSSRRRRCRRHRLRQSRRWGGRSRRPRCQHGRQRRLQHHRR